MDEHGGTATLAEIGNLNDRDLAVTTAMRVIGIEATVVKIEAHARTTNGQIAEIVKEQYIQQGAIGMLRVLVTWTLAGISAGAAVAGVILVIVARGI